MAMLIEIAPGQQNWLSGPGRADPGRREWGTITRFADRRSANRLAPAARDAVRPALAALPDDDRIRSFDAYRVRLLALPEAIAVASPARREELCRILVERVTVRDREISAIHRTPPARPFFVNSGSAPKGV